MTEPRASRIRIPAQSHIVTELWMGGADTAVGDPLGPADLRGAWVVDCAGDMPGYYRDAAGLWLFCVFADVEDVPSAYPRIETLARSLALCMAGTAGERDGWEHPHEPPHRLYVLCTQGLNRSGLVMGRILRGLGLHGDEVLHALARHRPGAVNNLTFARLVRE